MASRFILPLSDVGKGISPSDGAQLFFFFTGTSDKKATFSDEAATTKNPNPVIANQDGLFPEIWITGQYKAVLKDKNNVQKWEEDPVQESASVATSIATFDSVADARADANEIGSLIATKGFNSPGDGGEGEYIVSAAQTVDGFIDHLRDDGLTLLLQHNGTLYSEQLGITEAPFDAQPALQSIADDWDTRGVSSLILGLTNDLLNVSFKIVFTDDDIDIGVACDITCTNSPNGGNTNRADGTGVFTFSKTGLALYSDDTGFNPGQAFLAYGGVRMKNITVRSIGGRRTLDGAGSVATEFIQTSTNSVQLDTVSFTNCEDCFIEGFNIINGLVTNMTILTSRRVKTTDCVGRDPIHDNNFTASFDVGVVNSGKTTDLDLIGLHTFVDCEGYNGAFGFTALKCRGVKFIRCRAYDGETGFGVEEISGHVLGDLDLITFDQCEAIGITSRPYQITSNGVRLYHCVSRDCVKVITDATDADVTSLNDGHGIHASGVGDLIIYDPVISGMPNKGINVRAMTGKVTIFNPIIDDVAFDALYTTQALLDYEVHGLVATNIGRAQFRQRGNTSDRLSNISMHSCSGGGLGGVNLKDFGTFKSYDCDVVDGQMLFDEGSLVELHSPRGVVTEGADLENRGIFIADTVDVGKIYDPVIEQGSLEHILNDAVTRFGWISDESKAVGGQIDGDIVSLPDITSFTGTSTAEAGNFPQFSIIWNENITGGVPMGWRVVTAGTTRTLSGAVAVVGTTISGDRVFTVDNVRNIVVGNFISVAGEGLVYQVLYVDSVNLKIYIDNILTADRDTAAVTFAAPVFFALPNN